MKKKQAIGLDNILKLFKDEQYVYRNEIYPDEQQREYIEYLLKVGELRQEVSLDSDRSGMRLSATPDGNRKIQTLSDKGYNVTRKKANRRFASCCIMLLMAGLTLLWIVFDIPKINLWPTKHSKLKQQQLKQFEEIDTLSDLIDNASVRKQDTIETEQQIIK